MQTIFHVALPIPVHNYFDYLVKEESYEYQKGIRVKVPFGSQTLIGIVVEISTQTINTDKTKLKYIESVLDITPIISKDLFSLVTWISAYYHHPLGDCFQAVIPKRLRKGDSSELNQIPYWQLCINSSESNLGKKQVQIIELLSRNNGELSQQQIYKKIGSCKSSLLSLEKKNQIKHLNKTQLPEKVAKTTSCSLNTEQKICVESVLKQQNTFNAFLLDGITGSGKTEVYIELVRTLIEQQKQTLILIPEIGLTTQFVDRFKQRLAATIVSLNSSISDGDRKQGWLLAQQGIADVIIGTRSSVFTPLPNLGLVIIDEEHDSSYKQQDGLRYHARNVALIRAQRAEIPILLGSATPSLESLYQVKQGKYQLLTLRTRATGAQLPKIKVVDSAGPKADSAISSELYHGIKEQLSLGNQVLLFINRRGFAPVLMCHECNWQATCPQCDAKMIVHQSRYSLCCHHCGMIQRLPKQCPKCQHEELNTYGAGTEQIEQRLQHFFPDTPVIRVDRDSTQRVNAFSDLITDINQGEARILVGTQMLAKGHDFHNVTLVGVLDADQGLFSADFRATELLAQLIIQVTGRAGRGNKSGQVIIQTSQPQHEFWADLIQHGYRYTADKILNEREGMAMPPFGSLCVLRAEDRDESLAMTLLSEIRAQLEQVEQNEVIIMGPVPALMEKKAGRYRAQLLLSSQNRKRLHQLLDTVMSSISSLKLTRKVRWSIDIDPVDLM